MRKHYLYKLNIEAAEEGGYVVEVPALHGIVTQGETYEEALNNARELIVGYLECLDADGEAIPTEHPTPAHAFMDVAINRRVGA